MRTKAEGKSDVYAQILDKLIALKEHVRKLDKDVLKENLDILKRITQSVSLRFDTSSEGSEETSQKFRENTFLIKYHASLAEAQLLLTEKLSGLPVKN